MENSCNVQQNKLKSEIRKINFNWLTNELHLDKARSLTILLNVFMWHILKAKL